MQKAPRPDIPADMKRQVRRECFFGCVICGMPIFQYDHMTPYADVGEHTADNLALLCVNHHDDKTHGRLSEALVREGRSNPYNKTHSHATGVSYRKDRSLDLVIGGNKVDIVPENIDGETLIVLINNEDFFHVDYDEEWLSFSLCLTDENGKELLQVYEGEMRVLLGRWDVTFVGSTVKMWERNRKILFEVKLGSNSIDIIKATFANTQGDKVIVNPDGIIISSEGKAVMNYNGCSFRTKHIISLQSKEWDNGSRPPPGFAFSYKGPGLL